MIERKTILIRLYPNAIQEPLFRKTGGCVRLIKNLGLEQRATYGRRHPLNYYSQRAELKALKADFPFFKEVPHHCLQEGLIDLDRAFANFFSGRSGFPKRQRKRDGVSFRFPDPTQFRIEGDIATPDKKRTRKIKDVILHLPKFGAVKAVMHRALPHGAVIRSITVSSDGDWWNASLLYEREIGQPTDRSAETVIGIDVNVSQPIATSEGEIIDLPKVSKRGRERERRLHRNITRKQKGSKNRRKAIRALARFKSAQARRRKDAREKSTTYLAKNHGVIAMEALRLKNMTASARGTIAEPGSKVAQKAGLNRSLLDLGLGTTRMRLGQKLASSAGILLLVPAAWTSQRCNACGHIDADNRPHRDVFHCVACGHDADADINAACNIRDYALGLWGDSTKVEIAASLPLMLEAQAKALKGRKFGNKKKPEGLPGSVCGDLGTCAVESQRTSQSMKQKKTERELWNEAA